MESSLQSLGQHFRSLLRNPTRVGAIAPSSPQLCRLMASCVDPRSKAVMEIGAGTGVITEALLERGVEPGRLFVVERDPSLAVHLQNRFPDVQVQCGEALYAGEILSGEATGKVETIVSSLPFANMDEHERSRIVKAMLKLLGRNGQLIQFTYLPRCPLPIDSLGLRAKYVGCAWMNFPPAAVWSFRASASAGLSKS